MEPNGGQVPCGVTEHGSPCGAINFKVLARDCPCRQVPFHSGAKMLVVPQRCDFVVRMRQAENSEQTSEAKVYNRIRRAAAGRASAKRR
jgi:hypothetical protein